jgi:hypothetical protein
MTPLTVECEVRFGRAGRGGRKVPAVGPASPVVRPGRVPRVARLMALAVRIDELVRTGAVESYAEVARLGHVTRARVSQVTNLLNLAPDIQEALLFLPPTTEGRDAVILADLQPIASTSDWRKQRRMWHELIADAA